MATYHGGKRYAEVVCKCNHTPLLGQLPMTRYPFYGGYLVGRTAVGLVEEVLDTGLDRR